MSDPDFEWDDFATGDFESGDDEAVCLPCHVKVPADSSKRLRELRKSSAGSAHRERPGPHLVGYT